MNWCPLFNAGACRGVTALLMAVLVFTGPASGWAAAGAVENRPGVDGRLVRGEEQVAGGLVSAYLTIDLAGEPAAVSSPSGPDGKYSLDLKPGTYYLAASAGDMWTWCGQNPVSVDGSERAWIGFDLAPWSDPVVHSTGEETMEGTILGKVLRDGKPIEDVTVSLYFDESDGFRGMGFMRTPPTGADGIFRMDMVPEGRYFLIARKRGSGKGVGPMMKGDLISWYRFNPVKIEDGKELEIVLPMVVKRLDRDIHGDNMAGARPGFEGIVTDRDGRPVQGVHVFAYLEPEMGHHKPAALSSITDGQGRYQLFLPQAGKYYVGARHGYGDNPAPGEMFGHYEGTPDHSLTVESNRFLEEIGITVNRVLIP
jgi:hypothetical protein